MRTFLSSVIILCASVFSFTYFVEFIQQDLEMYRAEGKCIANYISKGVERRDIVARDGICYVVTHYDVIEKSKRLYNGAYL